MSNSADKKNTSRPDLCSGLQPHHRIFFLYGLFLVGMAMVVPTLSGLVKNQNSIAEWNEVFSHPPFIILFIALLLISALSFVLIGATHGKFWFRFLITILVASLLCTFSWMLSAAGYILLPVLFIIGYVLLRGSFPIPNHPTLKDIIIIFITIFSIWGIVFAFGFHLSGLGFTVTVYYGIAQLIALVSFLPMSLLLISGVDLANVTDKIVERMTSFLSQRGYKVVLITLLSTSVVKLGFNLWKIEWHSISSLIASLIFLAFFLCIARFTSKWLFEYKPKFTHWLGLTALIQPIPLGVATILIMFGVQLSIDSASTILAAAIGPITLVIAGFLSFFPKRRPFSFFVALMGVWVLLTSGLPRLSNLFFGFTFDGLTLWGLDGITAFLFILWSSWLLYHQKESPLVSTALKFSLFLSCCFIVDQLLKNQVAIAEIYTVFQILTYLAIHQFFLRPKQKWWIQILPWIVVVIMFLHNIWDGLFPDGVMSSVNLAILMIAMLWDIITSEEKIRGEKSIGPNQPGLLFLYLGVVIWTIAQVVYAKTGKGAAVLEWEPILLIGFLIVGIPWVLYLILRELKTKLVEMETKKE